jgi:uncharacterized protein (DUF302 family)
MRTVKSAPADGAARPAPASVFTDGETAKGTIMYTFDRKLSDTSMEKALDRTRKALADQGFGVLTEIDVKKTMKAKLGVDVDDYVILGACNPKMAHEALKLEPRIGAMLPCNVIVRSVEGGVEVSAVDPVASMAAVDNRKLGEVAATVRGMLQTVIERI